jgi:hypothetical protein
MNMKMAVIWHVVMCSLVDLYWYFRGVYCLHNQGPNDEGSKTLWNTNQYLLLLTWCNIPENNHHEVIQLNFNNVHQLSPTGSPQVTAGTRPLVTRPKLFVNLLLVTTSSFIFFVTLKDLGGKKNCDSYLVCCFMYKCHTHYWL